MKKYLFLILLLIPFNVHAIENCTITLTSSKLNVTKGDTITVKTIIDCNTPIGYYEYTLDYDSNILSLTSGSSYNVNRTNDDETKNITKTFKFKVKNNGTSKITVKSYGITSYKNDNNLSTKVKPITISNKTQTTNSNNNNYLSNLEVEGQKLTPSFDKNKTDYTITVDSKIDKIKINAKTESSKATLSGTGEFEIISGDNKFEVLVRSNDGEERIYTITVTSNKSDKTVKIDGKDYTLLKDVTVLEKPNGYEIKNIIIDDNEIKSYYSDKTKYTLVALIDENNITSLYVYDKENKTYTPYEYENNNISFEYIKTDKTIPYYIKSNIIINDINMDCYKTTLDSKKCLIYGKDLSTNEEGWYLYDSEKETFEKYDFELDDFYDQKIKNTQILIYILSGTTLIFGTTVIALAAKMNTKKKNKRKESEI